jgi:two-component system sensor histidine kinase/response regulator
MKDHIKKIRDRIIYEQRTFEPIPSVKTILLVDDDPQMRQSYGLVLRAQDYNVIEADSGTAGLEKARQFLPDLILSDIDMPRGDGADLLRNIRRDPELKSKLVVLMTGRPELVTPRRGMEEGADDFLVKPITRDGLLKCVAARFQRASINWRVEDEKLALLRSAVPANLPHEFFTPMAGIIGLMEILRTGSKEMTATEIAEIHDDVYESALRLNRILKNYLSILELQAASIDPLIGSLAAPHVEACLHAGIEEALRLNKRRGDLKIGMKAVALPIDRSTLLCIVEELLDNAFKFSRQGSPVSLELEDRRLVITDKGRGMTSDEIERIGAFQQFDRKKYEQQGLGLGLILVQKMCALNRATFTLKSNPGEGTRAEVVFPFVDVQA